jgi:hypothetical protein
MFSMKNIYDNPNKEICIMKVILFHDEWYIISNHVVITY